MIIISREDKENLKDMRLSLYLIVKDLRKLSEDVKCLADIVENIEKGRVFLNETVAQRHDSVSSQTATPGPMEGVLPDSCPFGKGPYT